MVRTRAICLDTHVVVWIAGGHSEKITKEAQALIAGAELLISPAVTLELQFLHEIGRVRAPATDAIRTLQRALDVRVAPGSYESVVAAALAESWTRDPFDRLIVAHARLLGAQLLSRDRRVAGAYAKTCW